jgi:hypothetical protein
MNEHPESLARLDIARPREMQLGINSWATWPVRQGKEHHLWNPTRIATESPANEETHIFPVTGCMINMVDDSSIP